MNQPQEGRPLLAPPLSHLPGMVFRGRADEERTMLFVSDGCRQVTGYGPDDLVQNEGVAYGELIYERDREMVEETIESALRERRPYQISYRIQTRVGEEKWVWEQGNGVFSMNGAGLLAVEGIVVDITPRRPVAQPQERQDWSTTVGQLASGIAHDFKNIMSIIVLYSELLERQPEHPRRQHFLSVITKQANHASRLIGQLLDYSRNSYMDGQILELNSFLEEISTHLEQTLRPAVELVIESTVDEALVAADSTRLQQVLLNLALNARDAMPDGGQLTVTLSHFELVPGAKRPAAFGRRALPGMEQGRWVRIEVTDTGTGIPVDVLPHIFEPFFTTKEAGRGTGLGLVQVDGIVEQLGGTVGVNTVLGKGTTFTIYLPFAQRRTRTRGRGEEPRPISSSGERILVVESNAETREAMEDAVRSLGYQVCAAASRREALARFEAQAERVDLLLITAELADLGGTELCRLIRRHRPTLPCVVIGSSGVGEHNQHELREEHIYWMQKPFSLNTLAQKLRLALER